MSLLRRPGLVVNRDMQALRVVTVARLVQIASAGRAALLDPLTWERFTWSQWTDLVAEEPEALHTPSRLVRLPSIAVLLSTSKMARPRQHVAFTRANLFARDHYSCQYCGQQQPKSGLSIDHVVPRCQGGLSTFENCVLACTDCNARKGGRTPAQCGMKLLRQPTRPRANLLASLDPTKIPRSWDTFVSHLYWSVPLQA
jgi:5-methylcytosine-specific restriction endonuclease McrA